MDGLMQERELLISDILGFAARYHRGAKIVTARPDGSTVHHTYPQIHARAAKLANALKARGVKPGERIATLAWNDHRHLELYYGISGIGAVCHTINPRLFPPQVAFIVKDAEDTHLFVDPMFLPLVEGVADAIAGVVKTIVVLDDKVPDSKLGNRFEVVDYESFIAPGSERIEWPRFDEKTAAALCYTSGTTGDPKGVLYSHRSTVLHAYAGNMADVTGHRSVDVVLPVVPLFHVCGWGIPYQAPMAGTSLVMPGPRLDGASIYRLCEQESVTGMAGVPTVWMGLLKYLRESGNRFTNPPRLVVGGSAMPTAIAVAFEKEYGVVIRHAWGMTEMSPLGTINMPKVENANWTTDERLAHFKSQGRPIFGVDLKVVDDHGNEVANDGKAFGELLVRGPWIASSYFGRPNDPNFTADGWFRTGDVVTIDQSGYIEIVDRAKDVIKSGGEWISSIELENIAVGHPAVQEAAVIGVNHPKWDERPLLLVVAKEGETPTRDELLGWYQGKVAKWWVPDDVVIVDSLPHTATGKLLKTELKKRFADHILPAA
ncbi:MAG TPA: long-chain-fatty-acid--CoA ligase [Hyphomicrobiales bacterium]|nr:long-chain-fatty-acid--CoA ligase [Hyphomicrobiales bacterium]